MSSSSEMAYRKFILEEAQWLDSEIRKFLPGWLVSVVGSLDRTPGLKWLGTLSHFLVDHVVISWILRIKITRNEERSLAGGKGFRPGFKQMKIDHIRTKVWKGKKEITERAFPLGIIIK